MTLTSILFSFKVLLSTLLLGSFAFFRSFFLSFTWGTFCLLCFAWDLSLCIGFALALLWLFFRSSFRFALAFALLSLCFRFAFPESVTLDLSLGIFRMGFGFGEILGN